MHASAPTLFDELVEPLGLKGPNRELCQAAFDECPDGFAACVDDAVARGRVPAALLVTLVRDGDHRDAKRPPVEPPRINRCGCSHAACEHQDVCLEAGR
jgi:hypothetical protein